jgi:hypothetical protein
MDALFHGLAQRKQEGLREHGVAIIFFTQAEPFFAWRFVDRSGTLYGNLFGVAGSVKQLQDQMWLQLQDCLCGLLKLYMSAHVNEHA